MLTSNLIPFLVTVCVVLVVIVGLIGLIKSFYVKVPQGTALIINDLGQIPRVSFTGAMVLPVIHKKEFMKISLLTLEIDRRGKDGLICKDNLRADITVAFYIRVNETADDVLRVAKNIGVERASDHAAVSTLFNAKFSEALKTAGKQFELDKLFEERLMFRERIREVIGQDLNGYILEDVAIDYLEQTPKSFLDPDNIFDSEGIRKITEMTANRKVITNTVERDQELAIQKKNVETREASLALYRQQADAEARQKREIETIRAREQAETLKVQEEERLKAEYARLQTEQEISVRDENRQREVEVAQQNRVRAVAIEVEKVTRARDLEVVSREREVELSRIEKEKALEEERKNIANVIRERVAVDKTVAIEEERIKEVRMVAEADRQKQVVVIDAQAQAEEKLVFQVKAAEADKESALFKAAEISTLAQAELEAATRQSDAKKRMAEGVEAEEAALGLAEARVRQAKAQAVEKEGLVEASITAEKMLAQARGQEEIGLAEAKILEAKAMAKEKEGLVEAKVLEEKLLAQARGEEQVGLVKARTTKEYGLAEADIIRERLKGEADGLTEKFLAINSLTDDARAHEEFRIQLEKHLEAALASMDANRDIAKEQAEVLAAALAKTNIDIVGGDGEFFDTFSKSLRVGKAINGLLGKSPAANALMEGLLARVGANDEDGGGLTEKALALAGKAAAVKEALSGKISDKDEA
ncbi:hypothetical protein LJB86_03945 [Deltaproteobacteria bacterium OttesenSCG-928-M10]|nr:hypothetical protein [Deltaproteobacteria bacterium OttesenSCG-928-M10]